MSLWFWREGLTWSFDLQLGPWGIIFERRPQNIPHWGLLRFHDADIYHAGRVRLIWGRTDGRPMGRPADGSDKDQAGASD
jgi:hypothetical protein